MARQRYFVTGATGKTGSAVVAQLLERGEHVRALVHGHDARSEALERLGAETVIADLFDPDRLLAAMRGTTRAYYCPPWHPHMIQSATAFAVAAREAKLEAIIGLTQWLASPSHPSLLTRAHWLADNVLSMVPGTTHVAIAPGYFADSYLMVDILRFAAHLGVFPWPYGDSKNAPPANEDIARVAVAVLRNPHDHAGRAYRPTGPDLLSGSDMAAILSRVFAREVRLLPLPMWMLVRAMRVAGWSAFEQLSARTYVHEHRRGTFAFNAPTDHVEALTGRPAETFETTARRYAALPGLVDNVANRARTLVDFARIGMRPSTDLDAFERNAEMPVPPLRRLAIDDERWLIERDPERCRFVGFGRSIDVVVGSGRTMTTNDAIREHYAPVAPGANSVSPGGDLAAKIAATADALEPAAFEAASAAGFDHFHVRGIAATAELAGLAGIDASTYVLDAGSGFGGPARYLAKTYGARVLGIDLTPAFVEVARMFAERLNLGELVTYEVGDLAALPFADGTFDVVWTQHVVMNVPDRALVYREFARVLKPGGKVAFHDVVAADGDAEPYYPVPWAETKATSFLMNERDTRLALEAAGFTLDTWDDVTEAVLAWFATAPAAVPQGLSLATLLGPRFGAMTANFALNVREGRVRIVMGIGIARS